MRIITLQSLLIMNYTITRLFSLVDGLKEKHYHNDMVLIKSGWRSHPLVLPHPQCAAANSYLVKNGSPGIKIQESTIIAAEVTKYITTHPPRVGAGAGGGGGWVVGENWIIIWRGSACDSLWNLYGIPDTDTDRAVCFVTAYIATRNINTLIGPHWTLNEL